MIFLGGIRFSRIIVIFTRQRVLKEFESLGTG
jgi:hypothetical protein